MTGNSQILTSDSPNAVTAQPRKVLKHIVSKGISGCVVLHDPQDTSVVWQLFVRGGQLAYATSATRKTERLQCLIRTTHAELARKQFGDDRCEYSGLCQWWHGAGLPMSRLRQLLVRLSLEALVQALAIPKATVEFDKASKVEPVLIETSLDEIPSPLWQMALQWQQWRDPIASPFTRLYLESQSREAFADLCAQTPTPLKADIDPQQLAAAAAKLLQQQPSVYQLARDLKSSPQNVVNWLQPFLAANTIVPLQGEHTQLLSGDDDAGTSTPDPSHRIACIDDSKTIQRQVRSILEMSGFEVLSITEPAQALTSLVRQKPAAILMDVNMPDIDGYELCSMLRQSRQLRDIPIIMLTGRDGILDRLRAKTLGVNFYLTKPFNPDRLVESIHKVLQGNTGEA